MRWGTLGVVKLARDFADMDPKLPHKVMFVVSRNRNREQYMILRTAESIHCRCAQRSVYFDPVGSK